MPVRINVSPEKIQVVIDSKWKNGLEMLSTEILNDCNQYCKEDTGMLIMSSYIHSRLDQGLLVWQTPYARRQYYKIVTAYTDVNPNARWKWAQYAKEKHLDEWKRKAKEIMRLSK